MRPKIDTAVGKKYCCNPVKVERKVPNGSARAEDKPTASSAIRTSGTRAAGI